MAGPKESPRQRMIGMMYLVLTALLALQVSSAIIEKFQALNESLEFTVNETDRLNNEKLTMIKTQVKNRGSQSKDLAIQQKAMEVNKRSSEMIKYINALKKQLIMETGGYDENGALKGAKEETQIEVMMIGASKDKGKAYELKRKLDEYVTYMQAITGRNFAPLALDAKDDPMYKNNDEQKNKDYAQLNFGQTPLVAALAVLSETETRIASMQATNLSDLAADIGIQDYKVKALVPIVSPDSRVVAAGTRYTARIGMAIIGTAEKPSMEAGSQTLQVDDNGIGNFSFMASGGNYGPDGTMKKTWTGKVKIKKPDGTDSVYTVTEEYIVAKPTIKIESAALSPLYRNCGNKLYIQVPALGALYNPNISADGAMVDKLDSKGRVIVVPKGPFVTLKIFNSGMFIGEEKLRVVNIPAPTIEVKVNGRLVNPILGVSKLDLRSINIKALAEKEFKASMPDDSYYIVRKWKVSIASGKRGTPPTPFTSETANISQLVANAKPGDRVIIEVETVQRRNYKGQWEDVKVSTMPISITITE